MEKKTCEVIGDLIPLYVDDVCSKESRQLVEEHLEECEACRQLYETMKMDVKISDDKEQRREDANIIKRVKRRIWIERIIIAVLALFVAGSLLFGVLLRLTATYKNMNDVVNMEEVYIEEDEKGNLWLVRSGNATMAARIMPEIYTQDGQPVLVDSKKIYNKLEDHKSYEMKVVFYESSLNYYVQKFFDAEIGLVEKEKSMLLSREKLERYGQIVMEQTDGTKKVLWEKE